jgi:hypothetical protein
MIKAQFICIVLFAAKSSAKGVLWPNFPALASFGK